MPSFSFALVAFGSVFSIVDPFAAVPIFLALTGKHALGDRKRVARQAALTCLGVLALFATVGPTLFRFFGITIPAFKVAGGVLLFTMSLEMMRAQHERSRTTREEQDEAREKQDVGIVPIGIPLLSGPGAVANAMMWSSRAHSTGDRVALYGAILAVSAITLAVLLSASSVMRVLGKTGINVMTRIMGLILAATAAQFVLDGWREAQG